MKFEFNVKNLSPEEIERHYVSKDQVEYYLSRGYHFGMK